MRLTAKQVTWLKVSLHLAGLLPFLWLVWRSITVDWVPIR
ncbi:sulfite oxidase subunit YedZ [Escherichia coli]|uniref:Sulfite oxidase subunit YedZ n=1 Tax=Escherichia coli TaxID=562 RepID=A0A376TDI6_ECOLX|nr:sulfite oxidase subunit YedZ [Escherichia coli]